MRIIGPRSKITTDTSIGKNSRLKNEAIYKKGQTIDTPKTNGNLSQVTVDPLVVAVVTKQDFCTSQCWDGPWWTGRISPSVPSVAPVC